MGTANNSSWTRVQQSLKEIERLIGQKQNNMAMIKARQILEFMVKSLGERALIVDGDLADSIDQLYEGKWISQATKDHYHRIRVLGNKAVHDGDDSPYDANETYHLLSQEILVFANQNKAQDQPVRIPLQGQSSQARPHQQSQGGQTRPAAVRASASRSADRSNDRSAERSAETRSGGSRPAASRPASGGGQHRRPSGSSQKAVSASTRSRRRTKRKGNDPSDLIKPLLILVVLIVLVAAVMWACGSTKDGEKESTSEETTEQVSTEAMSTTAAPEPTTQAPTEAAKIYKTKSKLNVRTAPDTTSAKLGTLALGTLVDYVETYDDTWTVIMFEGKQAYVATEFLTVEEAPAAEASESSAESSAAQ